MAESAISLHFERGRNVGWIRLDRPSRMNALDALTLDAMSDAIESSCDDDTVRAIVLIGEGGRAFSTGGDLKQLRQDELDGIGHRAEQAARRLYALLRHCPKPLIAAVDGHCLAAGFEIAILCDIIIATEQSRFGLSEIRFSLMPDAGLIELPRRIPGGVARAMLLTGLPISAQRAYQLGLVHDLCPDRDELLRAVGTLSDALALAAPLAVQAYKRIIDAGDEMAMEQAKKQRERWWTQISESEDRHEGLSAFLEKRAPAWKGR